MTSSLIKTLVALNEVLLSEAEHKQKQISNEIINLQLNKKNVKKYISDKEKDLQKLKKLLKKESLETIEKDWKNNDLI